MSYAPHDWPNSYVCVTAEHSDVSKFTEGSWQGSFAVNNERAVLASKQSRKSWYSQPPPPPKKKKKKKKEKNGFPTPPPPPKKKKKNYRHVAIQVQAFRIKSKRLRLSSHRNCIHDQILTENICRNINHSN